MKLSQGWAVKLPTSVALGIVMYHLGIVESIVNALLPMATDLPELGLVGAYFAIWCGDVLTGAGGALVRDIKGKRLTDPKKREFKSARLIMGFYKGAVHIVLLGASVIAAHHAGDILGWLPQAAFTFLVLTLLVSIIENIQLAGVGGPFLNAFARMLKKGGSNVGKK